MMVSLLLKCWAMSIWRLRLHRIKLPTPRKAPISMGSPNAVPSSAQRLSRVSWVIRLVREQTANRINMLRPKEQPHPIDSSFPVGGIPKTPQKGGLMISFTIIMLHWQRLQATSSPPKTTGMAGDNSILLYVFTCQTSSLSSRQGKKYPRGKQKKPHANGGMYIIRPSPAAPAGTCSMALSNGDHVRTQSSLCRQGFRNLQFLDTPTKKNMACWSHTFPHVIPFLMDRYG